MKVTPLDLRQQRFDTVMRGYDRGEVTAFLTEVAEDYENALRETDRLRQEVAQLEAVLAEHRGQERNLRNTLLTAQKMADQVKDQAGAEAERMIREAEGRADAIVQKSKSRIEEMHREIETMRLRRREVETTVESLVASLQGTLGVIRDQESRLKDEGVVLMHRPKHAEPTPAAVGAAAAPAAAPAATTGPATATGMPNERVSQG